MVGLGISEIEAKRYEEKLKKGNYLIAASTCCDLYAREVLALGAHRAAQLNAIRADVLRKTRIPIAIVLQVHDEILQALLRS